MAKGASFGCYGPTNKKNAVGGEGNYFAMKEVDRCQRLKFELKKKERGGKRTIPPNKHGGPSPVARKRIPKMKVAGPKDFFHLQFTPEFVRWMKMQQTAVPLPRVPVLALESSRIGSLLTMQNFTGSLVFSLQNGLAPKPKIDYWFEPAEVSPLFGNDIVSRVMAKEVMLAGKRI
jgi:hypothetical protein